MSECAEQLSSLSSQPLGFKRDQALSVAPTDLTQLVQRAIRLAHAHRALTGVEVRTAFGVDQPIACSGPLLVQALMNLIEPPGTLWAPAAGCKFHRIDVAVKREWSNPATGTVRTGSLRGSKELELWSYSILIPKGTRVYSGPSGSQGGVFMGGFLLVPDNTLFPTHGSLFQKALE